MFVTCILYGRVSWLEWLHHRPSISGVSIQCWLLAQHGHTASTLTRGNFANWGGRPGLKTECCCVIDTISLIRLNENTFHHMSANEFTSFECITFAG